MASLTLADRLAGSLLGVALGDALGFVVEAAPPELAQAYARELGASRACERRHPEFPFGQYSDDTQLARELLLSLRDSAGWDPAAFARRVAELFRDGRPVGAGPGTSEAAARLLMGVTWEAAGTPTPYTGNGGAMRAAPIGVLFRDDPERLVAVAAAQCRVTHQDPRCVGGAVAVASAAALAVSAEPIDSRDVLRDVAEMVVPVSADMVAAVREVERWLDLPPHEARRRLQLSGLDPGEGEPWRGISTHVVPSVAWSLYAALRSPDDFWTAVCTAIEPGGDTDTMAAMAGGIVGGRVGAGGLPNELLERLNDRGRWRADALDALARECAGCAPSSRAE